LLQGKGTLLLLYPSHREEKNIMLGLNNIMLGLAIIVLQKVNKANNKYNF
jgi:hypothetical protein